MWHLEIRQRCKQRLTELHTESLQITDVTVCEKELQAAERLSYDIVVEHQLFHLSSNITPLPCRRWVCLAALRLRERLRRVCLHGHVLLLLWRLRLWLWLWLLRLQARLRQWGWRFGESKPDAMHSGRHSEAR